MSEIYFEPAGHPLGDNGGACSITPVNILRQTRTSDLIQSHTGGVFFSGYIAIPTKVAKARNSGMSGIERLHLFIGTVTSRLPACEIKS
jgi:hypothetical protein